MLPWQTNVLRQLNEIHLIQSSLLLGEQLAFMFPPDSEDLAVWISLLDTFAEAGGFDDNGMTAHPPCQARFEVRIVGAPIWFEITLPRCTEPVPESTFGVTQASISTNADTMTTTTISVRGERLSRDDQTRWQSEVQARINEIMRDEACAFPVYELLTLLTSTLHQSQGSDRTCDRESTTVFPLAVSSPPEPQPLYHAFLTSHHLVSPAKRRSLQQWSSQLSLSGFAKVGYPGVIYVEGAQDGVETFVRNVKGMQWLALRIRFVEPVPESKSRSDGIVTRDCRPGASGGQPTWVELSKIGEVLEHMRTRGREALVTNLGIGAPSKETRR